MIRKLILVVVTLLFVNIAQANIKQVLDNSPTGYWQTIDDVTGKPQAIVQIWETSSKILQGRIIKLLNKEDEKKLCQACNGDKHNQPILGMLILDKLKFDTSNKWDQGNILDPDNGKIYRCTVRLSDNGQKLNVHGYIGFPLFGRSQIWLRVNPDID